MPDPVSLDTRLHCDGGEEVLPFPRPDPPELVGGRGIPLEEALEEEEIDEPVGLHGGDVEGQLYPHVVMRVLAEPPENRSKLDQWVAANSHRWVNPHSPSMDRCRGVRRPLSNPAYRSPGRSRGSMAATIVPSMVESGASTCGGPSTRLAKNNRSSACLRWPTWQRPSA